MRRGHVQAGFSLTELLIAMAVMLIVSGAAVTALMRMTEAQATIWNRTQMHSGIRGATEVLQQEVGQAGRIALPLDSTGAPYVVTLTSAVTVPVTSPPSTVTAALTIDSTKPTGDETQGMFLNQKLIVGTGAAQETVTITALTNNSITAAFSRSHAAGEPILSAGAFGTGIVPPAVSPSAYAPGGSTFTYTNGSRGDVLKLYGDINADGNMVYIEYTCDTTTSYNLYRNVMAWNAATKPAVAASQILLSNVRDNPNATPCFTYQTEVVGGNVYVTDVAITLTVQTQLIDPVTKQFQRQTKALLNVSPRNTFNAWQLASLGIANRIQPMPPSVAALLPDSP